MGDDGAIAFVVGPYPAARLVWRHFASVALAGSALPRPGRAATPASGDGVAQAVRSQQSGRSRRGCRSVRHSGVRGERWRRRHVGSRRAAGVLHRRGGDGQRWPSESVWLLASRSGCLWRSRLRRLGYRSAPGEPGWSVAARWATSECPQSRRACCEVAPQACDSSRLLGVC